MKIENFDTFLGFFTEAGHDINAKNPNGNTLLAVISEHRHGNKYVDALKKHGAV